MLVFVPNPDNLVVVGDEEGSASTSPAGADPSHIGFSGLEF